MNQAPGTPHLVPSLLAAYLDGGLAGEERAEVEGHLADCPECAEELVAVHRLRGAGEKRSRAVSPFSRVAVLATAAAAVLAILVLRPGTDTDSPLPSASPRQRAALPDRSPITVESPVEGAAVPRVELSFSWTANQLGGGPYRLVVTSEQGDSLWAEKTAATTVVPPATLTLEAGRTYLWSVESYDELGRPITSGLHVFRLAP